MRRFPVVHSQQRPLPNSRGNTMEPYNRIEFNEFNTQVLRMFTSTVIMVSDNTKQL
jgi:hypothetical protein